MTQPEKPPKRLNGPEYGSRPETPLRRAYKLAAPLHDADSDKAILRQGRYPLGGGVSVHAIASNVPDTPTEIAFIFGEEASSVKFVLGEDRAIRIDVAGLGHTMMNEILDRMPGALEEQVDDFGESHMEPSERRERLGRKSEDELSARLQAMHDMKITIQNSREVHGILSTIKNGIDEPIFDDVELIEPEDDVSAPSSAQIDQFVQVFDRLTQQETTKVTRWENGDISYELTTKTDVAGEPKEMEFVRTTARRVGEHLTLLDKEYWTFADGKETQFYTVDDVNQLSLLVLPDDHPEKSIGNSLLKAAKRQRGEKKTSNNPATARDNDRLTEILADPSHVEQLQVRSVLRRKDQLSGVAPDDVLDHMNDNGFPYDWLNDIEEVRIHLAGDIEQARDALRSVRTLDIYWNDQIDNHNQRATVTGEPLIEEADRAQIIDVLAAQQPRADELHAVVSSMHALADREDLTGSDLTEHYVSLYEDARNIVLPQTQEQQTYLIDRENIGPISVEQLESYLDTHFNELFFFRGSISDRGIVGDFANRLTERLYALSDPMYTNNPEALRQLLAETPFYTETIEGSLNMPDGHPLKDELLHLLTRVETAGQIDDAVTTFIQAGHPEAPDPTSPEVFTALAEAFCDASGAAYGPERENLEREKFGLPPKTETQRGHDDEQGDTPPSTHPLATDSSRTLDVVVDDSSGAWHITGPEHMPEPDQLSKSKGGDVYLAGYGEEQRLEQEKPDTGRDTNGEDRGR